MRLKRKREQASMVRLCASAGGKRINAIGLVTVERRACAAMPRVAFAAEGA
jgi:hypothetical protein